MVPVAGLDAQDARVAARAVEVALAEGREEGREVLVGFLVYELIYSVFGSITLNSKSSLIGVLHSIGGPECR